MTAKDWKILINASSSGLDENWMNYKSQEFGLGKKHAMWYRDQWITTLSLIKNRICNVPGYSGLWKNQYIGGENYLQANITLIRPCLTLSDPFLTLFTLLEPFGSFWTL